MPDNIPRMFVGLPLEDDPSPLSRHRVHRIIAPCQAPFIMDGNTNSFHMTTHPGYAIKIPSNFEHEHRNGIVRLTKASKGIIKMTETVAGFAHNISPQPGIQAAAILTSLGHTADNVARLRKAGIDPNEPFKPHNVENSGKEELEGLLHYVANANRQDNITGGLEAIRFQNGQTETEHTIWVCHDCLDCLQQGKNIDKQDYLTLSQYKPLVQTRPELTVTLSNIDSIIVLTRTLRTYRKVHKLTIHIESSYFERRGRTSSLSYFEELGHAIRRQRSLTDLEIHGKCLEGTIYAGLRVALMSYSLKRLCVSGIANFLEVSNISRRRRYLRKLEYIKFDNVLVETKQAASNLRALFRRSLVTLVVTQASFTSDSLGSLFVKDRRKVRKPFKRLKHLDMSYNSIAAEDVLKLLKVVLARRRLRLQCVDLTGNQEIRATDGKRIKAMLKAKVPRAVLKMDDMDN